MQNYENLIIKGINIIPLITGQALVLVQTDAGIMNNTINLNENLTEENCKDASKFLTTNLYNKKIKDIIENFEYYNDLFKNQIKYFQEFFSFITETLKNYSNNNLKTHSNISNLLENPEYKDIGSAKKFLSLVENEEKISKIIKEIDETSNNDIVYSIGEDDSDEYSEYSIIKANYSLKNGVIASVGIQNNRSFCIVLSGSKQPHMRVFSPRVFIFANLHFRLICLYNCLIQKLLVQQIIDQGQIPFTTGNHPVCHNLAGNIHIGAFEFLLNSVKRHGVGVL